MRAIYTGLVLLALLAIVETPTKAKGNAMSGSQGPLAPVSVVNDTSFGTRGWLTPTVAQISADDTSFASPSGAIDPQTVMNYHRTGFAFTPDLDAANITLTVRVRRRKVAGPVNLRDASVRLVIGGVIQSAEVAESVDWPSSDGDATYTFTGLSIADVADCGLALSCKNTALPPGQFKVATPGINLIEASISW